MSLRWWHPLAAGAGMATLLLLDEPLRDGIQDNRTSSLDDMADFTAHFKDREVFFAASGGAYLLGSITRDPKILITSVHIMTAYGLSGAMMIGTKWAFGRTRPSDTPDDPTDFTWFDGGASASFPSGSSAVVFSLATTLADAVDRTPITVALYTGAVANAWARLNADRHWLTDVTLGALYGITAAKFVNGEWTVFGLSLPTIWTDGEAAGLRFSIPTERR